MNGASPEADASEADASEAESSGGGESAVIGVEAGQGRAGYARGSASAIAIPPVATRHTAGRAWRLVLAMPGLAPDASRPTSRGAVALVFAVLAAVYVWEAPPQPAWGDGMAFLLTTVTGLDGDTNATSHFLYLNLGVVLAWLVPVASNAAVLVGLSVASALGALGLAYQLARDAASVAGALFGTAVLGLAFTFWRHAVTIEVYAFHLLFVMAIALVAVRGAERQDDRHAVGLAALWGMSLLVHIQNVLLGPLALYYLWRVRPSPARLAAAAAVWAAVVAPLVVLPLVGHAHPVSAVLVEGTHGPALAFGVGTLARGVALSVGYAVYNFHVWLVPIGVGAVRLWRERPAVGRALALVAGPCWLFGVCFPVSDSYVFYLTAYAVAVPCAAIGFDALLARASPRVRWGVVAASLVVGPAVYASAVRVAQTTEAGQRVERDKGYKGGVAFYLYPGMRGAPDPLTLGRPGARVPPGAPPPLVDAARRYRALTARRPG